MLGILWECGLHMIRNTSKSNEISDIMKACLFALVISGVGSGVFVMFQIALSRIINN
ncbi:hypothetical protein GA0061100_102384 [Rhizobium hainanense]|uniref:Uncharacterized protein n=1 Tax=Rhizobium hainanense TaxID=52131 RepID=A0A1C3UJE6_9HYPH|nr:hypothetical protein GA0061100_102384 [Rhizobium hainanense]